jgi:transposase-like protein
MMEISDDRWTCPYCERTFTVEGSFGSARARLAAVQATHAREHAGIPRGLPVTADQAKEAR